MTLLQAIPEGPAWAVALSLLGGIVILVIREVGKIRKNGNGDRHGTRRDDDRRLTREEIKEGVTLFNLVTAMHSAMADVTDISVGNREVLARISATMEAAQRTADLHAGLIETLTRAVLVVDERSKALLGTSKFLEEMKDTRHELRNILTPAVVKASLAGGA